MHSTKPNWFVLACSALAVAVTWILSFGLQQPAPLVAHNGVRGLAAIIPSTPDGSGRRPEAPTATPEQATATPGRPDDRGTDKGKDRDKSGSPGSRQKSNAPKIQLAPNVSEADLQAIIADAAGRGDDDAAINAYRALLAHD